MDKPIIIPTEEFIKKRPLSKSSLAEFRKGPKYYIEYITKPKIDKPEFAMGNAVECLLLESSKFKSKFFVYEKFEKRSNDAKDKWKALLEMARVNKVSLLTKEEKSQAELMAKVAKENPNCKYWLDIKRNIQKKLVWFDKKTKLWVIGYVDFDSEPDEGQQVIVDIKTDYVDLPSKFFKRIYENNYDLQIGSYCLGYHRLYYQFPNFMFMVITKEAPYDAYMVHVPPKEKKDAKDEFNFLLKAFRYCMEKNLWHMGVDFWLMDTLPYHTLEKPRYFKSRYIQE